MPYVLDKQLTVGIYFGDYEYPLEHSNTIDALVIETMIGTILPTFFLKISDASDVIQQRGLIKDGALVKIVLSGPGAKELKQYKFRIFKSKNQTTQMGTQWIMDGYLDHVKYWLETSNQGHQGTSSRVLAQIAKQCGLKTAIEATADDQLWMQQNKTNGEFVRDLVKRGFSTPDSLFVQGVDLNSVLIYKDFNKQQPPVADFVYGQYGERSVPIMDYAPSSQSGMTNRITGYNNVRFSQSAVRPSSKYKEIVLKSDSKQPMISQEIKATASRGYQQYGPIDFGNTHEDSERAFYQNQRYANLYNMSVEFMTTVVSNVSIFDTITFSPKSGPNENDSAYAGKYRVSAVQIRLEGKTYTEYICGERHGTNKNGPDF